MSATGSLPGWKMAIDTCLRPLGVELRRRRSPLNVLARLQPRTILDIGANVGQFYREARAHAAAASIHCFEPLPAACSELRNLAKTDANLHLHPVALGDSDGVTRLNACEYAPASSILPHTDTYTKVYPFAVRTTAIEVRIATLDSVCSVLGIRRPLFVKVDVQGYEIQVLRGGKDTIGATDMLLVELSLTPLYHGQPTASDLIGFCEKSGLSLRDIYTASHGSDGLPAFCDLLFAKRA